MDSSAGTPDTSLINLAQHDFPEFPSTSDNANSNAVASPQSPKKPDRERTQEDRREFKTSYHDFGGVVDNENDFGHRLYKAGRGKTNKEKEESDAIVSELCGETLRWLKKRRDFSAENKVVISSFREKQLREMFQSLDFEGNGAINLDELTEAVTYVQHKTKHSKGLEQFQNIQETFIAMDDNGDGTVDFSEFINAMTGTTQSTFDKASEYDVERLFSYFIEYGEAKQRETAWKKITEAQLSEVLKKGDDNKAVATDAFSVKHFKALFGATEESERKYSSRVAAKNKSKELSARKSAHMEQILQDFIDTNAKSPSKKFSRASFNEISTDFEDPVEEKSSPSKFTDADYLELQNRLREERNETMKQQNLILAEAGLLDKKKTASRSSVRFSRINLPTLEEVNGSFKLNDNSTSSTLLETSKSIHLHNTHLPSVIDTKQELQLRSTAKKEAYDIIRKTRSVDETPEDSTFRMRTSTFDASYGNSQLSTPKGSVKSSFAASSDVLSEMKSPTRRSMSTIRKSVDLTRKSVEFSISEGSLRLPSIPSLTSNGTTLVTGSSMTSSTSKKNQMIRASFAF